MSTPIGQVAKPIDSEPAPGDVAAAVRRSRLPSWVVILWANRKSRIGLIMLGLFIFVAVFAPLLATHDPKVTDFAQSLPPGGAHPLGTTASGQDILSQLVYGARTSIVVGLVAGTVVTFIALLVGLTAGYLQGWVDEVLSFLINLALVVPVLPLMITIAAYSPVRGLFLIIFVISITGWAWGARVKRAQILTLRSRDYITAARFAGEGRLRIIFAEIMPNMMSLVVAGFLGAAAGAIGAEAGLEFLGLGDPTTVSWGTMLYWANNSGAMLTGQWIWLGAPGLAIALLLSSLTLINFGVDALSNPHLRER
ncbi:ABC transporter permease [Actinopolymorpha alba]|uniref:ABC transporter permease n=1 Tax=Actinopolymorpha alba TaxID=533267 RepID=UPI0003632B3D|nr:ABC transporter permease [Actinopolymorpha alba]